VLLDTYEIAVVHSANPDPSQLHRPVVRIVTSSEGAKMGDGVLADLGEMNGDGTFKRSIIKVVDPDRFGIRPSDYFV
jgi:hypothetical protein